MSNSLWPHGPQHARLPCPSLSPRVCSNSCPVSQWCYLTISSSATLFSFCLQSFPASGSFPVSQFFAWGGQSIGASASASQADTEVFPINIESWFPSRLTGLISLQSKRLSRVFFSTTIWKYQFFDSQTSMVQLSHMATVYDYWKNHRFAYIEAKWCQCFLMCCLDLSQLFFQGGSIFLFHGCSHHLQWFWSPRK